MAATVEDTVDKIRAWQRAVIVTEVRPKIWVRTAALMTARSDGC